MPGMEDEPSSTFQDLSLLMEKLGLSVGDDDIDSAEVKQEVVKDRDPMKNKDSKISQEQIKQKETEKRSTDVAWREERNKSTPEIGK